MDNKTIYTIIICLFITPCICRGQALFTSEFNYCSWNKAEKNKALANKVATWILRDKGKSNPSAYVDFEDSTERLILASIVDDGWGDPLLYAFSLITENGTWSISRHWIGHNHKYCDFESHESTLLIPIRTIVFFNNEMEHLGVAKKTVHSLLKTLTAKLLYGNKYGFIGGYCEVPSTYCGFDIDKVIQPTMLNSFKKDYPAYLSTPLSETITNIYEYSFRLDETHQERIDRDILISIYLILNELITMDTH